MGFLTTLVVAVAQFTVAREPEHNLEIIDGFARSEVSARNIGCSRIVDPMGETLIEADGNGPALITAALSREVLTDTRRILPVLVNRRFADPVLRG
ncbi:hypothetical protein BW13_03950 [Bifidobacterium sp. UTCIF-37]|uniref:hypothetical protein n=1 Tax=unclassified Bifidobacterium TaxID=2608897 RepID=UPI001C613F39|nr:MULTISPECIES: hypothetical protein [unclassified Bifidobacterium]TPF86665.1 hypothetical protein BW13_03950 [Bifidobacterium sp. UTCIF-37]TPF90283.1 hypothetical protein BW11_03945 [Bifidobacterium sp. UTCIF-38]